MLERITSIKYNGRKYTQKANGYYYNCSTRKHLHQAIWIDNNGPIPEGYEIHHIDMDKENNDISNLACIPIAEHHRIHKEAMTDEQRQKLRDNLNENARPKAIEWHKSDAGREWHAEHIRQQHKNGAFTHNLICTQCGKEYVGEIHKTGGNTFCSGACKARYLRRKRSEDRSVIMNCIICGTEFTKSKWSSRKTCSRSCAMKLKHINDKG